MSLLLILLLVVLVFCEIAEGLLVVFLEVKLSGSTPATLCRGTESNTVSVHRTDMI